MDVLGGAALRPAVRRRPALLVGRLREGAPVSRVLREVSAVDRDAAPASGVSKEVALPPRSYEGRRQL